MQSRELGGALSAGSLSVNNRSRIHHEFTEVTQLPREFMLIDSLADLESPERRPLGRPMTPCDSMETGSPAHWLVRPLTGILDWIHGARTGSSSPPSSLFPYGECGGRTVTARENTPFPHVAFAWVLYHSSRKSL